MHSHHLHFDISETEVAGLDRMYVTPSKSVGELKLKFFFFEHCFPFGGAKTLSYSQSNPCR